MSLYTLEENQSLCVKVESEMNVPAARAFLLLSDLSRRPEWDKYYKYAIFTPVINLTGDVSIRGCVNSVVMIAITLEVIIILQLI